MDRDHWCHRDPTILRHWGGIEYIGKDSKKIVDDGLRVHWGACLIMHSDLLLIAADFYDTDFVMSVPAVLAEAGGCHCLMLSAPTEPAEAGGRDRLVSETPKPHESCRPHRREDHLSGPCLIYAALVANLDDRSKVGALTVDGQTVGRMWTELNDKPAWDRNVPCNGCDVEGVASIGRDDVFLS